jgi:hypothetical protein
MLEARVVTPELLVLRVFHLDMHPRPKLGVHLLQGIATILLEELVYLDIRQAPFVVKVTMLRLLSQVLGAVGNVLGVLVATNHQVVALQGYMGDILAH